MRQNLASYGVVDQGGLGQQQTITYRRFVGVGVVGDRAISELFPYLPARSSKRRRNRRRAISCWAKGSTVFFGGT